MAATHISTKHCSTTTIGTLGLPVAMRFQKKLERLPNIGAAEITAIIHGSASKVLAATTATKEGAAALEREIMATVDREIGAIARPARVCFVTVLPKTRSGKLLRRSIQAICEGRDPGDLTTIEDPGALEQIRIALR